MLPGRVGIRVQRRLAHAIGGHAQLRLGPDRDLRGAGDDLGPGAVGVDRAHDGLDPRAAERAQHDLVPGFQSGARSAVEEDQRAGDRADLGAHEDELVGAVLDRHRLGVLAPAPRRQEDERAEQSADVPHRPSSVP